MINALLFDRFTTANLKLRLELKSRLHESLQREQKQNRRKEGRAEMHLVLIV